MVVTRHTGDKPWITDGYRLLIRKRQRAHMRGDIIEARSLRNLNIIELAMCVGVCVSYVLDSQLLNGWTYGHENCRVCSRTRSHDSVIVSYFLD